jgi:hypothetical protein
VFFKGTCNLPAVYNCKSIDEQRTETIQTRGTKQLGSISLTSIREASSSNLITPIIVAYVSFRVFIRRQNSKRASKLVMDASPPVPSRSHNVIILSLSFDTITFTADTASLVAYDP